MARRQPQGRALERRRGLAEMKSAVTRPEVVPRKDKAAALQKAATMQAQQAASPTSAPFRLEKAKVAPCDSSTWFPATRPKCPSTR